MGLTVKQISENLKVNRNKVYRAIEKCDLKPETVNGISYYDDQAIKAIKEELKRIDKKRSSKSDQTPDPEPQTRGDQSDLVEALRETIKVQSETIDHLKAENVELREMLKREQEIRFGQLAIEVSSKPKLTDRIKSRLFGRGKKPEVNDQD